MKKNTDDIELLYLFTAIVCLPDIVGDNYILFVNYQYYQCVAADIYYSRFITGYYFCADHRK